jgi:Protease inhibitor Inh
MHPIGLLLILLLALGAPAAAQAPDPAPPPERPVIPDAKTLAANYELSSAIGDRKCPVALEAKPVGPGFTLVYDKPLCLPLFGFLNETVAWLPGIAGSIRFVNAAKRTVSEFTEGVGGRYEALREGDGVYFLSNLQFVDPGEAPQFADLLGEWNMARPNGPTICAVTLTDQSTGEDTFVVSVKPGCDQSITRFGPVSWVLDRGDIILFSAKGERLRFGRQQEGGWAKVPDTPRPLLLARP